MNEFNKDQDSIITNGIREVRVMKKTNKKRKGMSKGKCAAIIGGTAVVGSFIADAIMIAATPVTGGLSLGALAAKKSVELAIATGVGAAVGGGTGVVATKVVSSKQTAKKVETAIKETSNAYEAKFAQQAKEFTIKAQEWAEKAESWKKEKQEWEHTKEEKDDLFNDCLKYIQDLEKERDSLAQENKKLSVEKQKLLKKLYGIRTKLSAS